MNADDLRRIIVEEIGRALVDEKAAPAAAPVAKPTVERAAESEPGVPRWLRQRAKAPYRAPTVTPPPPPTNPSGRPILVEDPSDPSLLRRFVAATPSRIGVGRAGTRYLTDVYIRIRGDHAIAKDAVYSETRDELIQKLGCVALKTDCADRQDYLLYPAKGRRLHAESVAVLAKEGTRGADIQIIVGDGLSAWAADANAPELVPLLQRDLGAAGWSVGKPLFVRFARVGVQDQIGVLLGAKATVILVGERPGLGTGDSLSIYIAYGPKLEQDNAEKNCISNVRALGILPAEASRETVAILRQAFAAGGGGVAGRKS